MCIRDIYKTNLSIPCTNIISVSSRNPHHIDKSTLDETQSPPGFNPFSINQFDTKKQIEIEIISGLSREILSELSKGEVDYLNVISMDIDMSGLYLSNYLKCNNFDFIIVGGSTKSTIYSSNIFNTINDFEKTGLFYKFGKLLNLDCYCSDYITESRRIICGKYDSIFINENLNITENIDNTYAYLKYGMLVNLLNFRNLYFIDSLNIKGFERFYREIKINSLL